MMGEEFLPKHSPDKYQNLVMLSGVVCYVYTFRKSNFILDKTISLLFKLANLFTSFLSNPFQQINKKTIDCLIFFSYRTRPACKHSMAMHRMCHLLFSILDYLWFFPDLKMVIYQAYSIMVALWFTYLGSFLLLACFK